ncbi:unnamed protein product [Larinioides sclopetarius]|uniref:Uncharacterized protein n=1 Tax=Larinioides sclopetarius TaxID=280406 RepID=A0AAV1Z5D3_9ARAC
MGFSESSIWDSFSVVLSPLEDKSDEKRSASESEERPSSTSQRCAPLPVMLIMGTYNGGNLADIRLPLKVPCMSIDVLWMPEPPAECVRGADLRSRVCYVGTPVSSNELSETREEPRIYPPLLEVVFNYAKGVQKSFYFKLCLQTLVDR